MEKNLNIIRMLACSVGLFLITNCQTSLADEVTFPVGEFKSPIVGHGDVTSKKLPNGDLFELPQQSSPADEKGINWSVKSTNSEGVSYFTIDQSTFGAEETEVSGLKRGLSAQGISLAKSNSKATALTCSDDFWDLNLVMAGSGDTKDDLVTVTLQNSDGKGLKVLAQFKYVDAGLEITELHPYVDLFLGNRLAMGGGKKTVGGFIPLSLPAGQKGQRTDLVTMAFSMASDSPFMGMCFQLGLEIEKKSGSGIASAVFTDIVVVRSAEKKGTVDAGLIEGLLPPYNNNPVCQLACPAGGTGETCRTLCFESPSKWVAQLKTMKLQGLIVIGGSQFMVDISTPRGKTIARNAMTNDSDNPLAKLNKQYVAAQLSVLFAGGSVSPNVLGALSSSLNCYKLFERTGLDISGIALSTGVTITPRTQLRVLFEQGRIAATSTSTSTEVAKDREMLAILFGGLYNNDVISSCTNPSITNSQAVKSLKMKLTKNGKKKLQKRKIPKRRVQKNVLA